MRPTASVGIGLLLVALAALILTLVPGCSGESAYSRMTAKEIYELRCQQCHGPRGLATTGLANSFAGKRRHWEAASLIEYLENPPLYKTKVPHLASSRRYMPPQVQYMPDEAKQRLATYVLGLMDQFE